MIIKKWPRKKISNLFFLLLDLSHGTLRIANDPFLWRLLQTFNEGISYLNKSQECKLRNDAPLLLKATNRYFSLWRLFCFVYLQIYTTFIFCFSRNISPDEEDMIEKICNELRQDSQKVDFDISNFSAGAKYILYEEIRTRCPHFSSMPDFLYKVSSISFSLFLKDEE